MGWLYEAKSHPITAKRLIISCDAHVISVFSKKKLKNIESSWQYYFQTLTTVYTIEGLKLKFLQA